MATEAVAEPVTNKRGQKLYYYLSRLTAEDLDNFFHYLQSPLLGNSPQMARMLRTIQEHVLGTERVTIDADLFAEEFSPGHPLDTNKVKYIRIRLVQLQDKLMDFLSFSDYRQDRNARDIHLLKSLYKRGMEKHFEKVHAEIEAQPPVKADGEYLMYRLWRMVVLNDFLNDRASGVSDTHIPEVHNRIDLYFAHLKYKYGAGAISKELAGGKQIEIRNMDIALEFQLDIDSVHHQETCAYEKVYHLFYELKHSPSPREDFLDELEQFLEPERGGDSSELRDFFTYALAFCLNRFHNGFTEFRNRSIYLYDKLFGSTTVFENGYIPRFYVKNAIINACRVGNVEWAENFLEKNKFRIAGDGEFLAYYHNKAYLAFAKREYQTTIDLIYNRMNQYDESEFSIQNRVLIIRSLWEMKEYEWLLPNIEAFRQVLRRESRAEDNSQKNLMLFTRFMRKLCQAKLGNPDKIKHRAAKVRKEILQSGRSGVLLWLMQQVQTLLDE